MITNKKICFDIDGVICKTIKNKYRKSKPIKKAISKINNLYKNNTIILFTARYMGRSNERIFLAKKRAKIITEKQLKKWGVNYDKLIFGKPSFDYVIDDKSIFFRKDWTKYF